MGIGANIIFAIVMLHLLAGFGYIVFKLMPRKEDQQEKEKESADV